MCSQLFEGTALHLNFSFRFYVIVFDLIIYLKAKVIPVQAWGFLHVEASRFRESRRIKVARLSAIRTGRFCLQEIVLVLISVRGLFEPWALVRSEGLRHWRISMTPTEIEPRAQWLNQLYYRVPPWMYLHELRLNNRYRIIQTFRHSTMTASSVSIRSVSLRTVVEEFQIPCSSLTPRHSQHTKNVHDTEIHTSTDRKLQ